MLHTLRNGLALAALVAAVAACGTNGETTPEPDPAPAPAPAPEPAPDPGEGLQVTISPRTGATATDVEVVASGFEPGARVGIGFGPVESEYEVVTHATADADGRVATTVDVPDWVEAGRDYVFVAVAPDGRDVISDTFRVTAGGDEGGGDEGGEIVRVTGVLTDEGVECPALRTDQGELYTLAGDTGRFEAGDRVTVEGTVAEMSYCMQGTTLSVRTISGA